MADLINDQQRGSAIEGDLFENADFALGYLVPANFEAILTAKTYRLRNPDQLCGPAIVQPSAKSAEAVIAAG